MYTTCTTLLILYIPVNYQKKKKKRIKKKKNWNKINKINKMKIQN